MSKLIDSQGDGMVIETLAAMRASLITEDNLVPVVHELVNRFPIAQGDAYQEGAGQPANSMGPLYTSGAPYQSTASPSKAAAFDEGSESTDSEDDMGDLRLLG